MAILHAATARRSSRLILRASALQVFQYVGDCNRPVIPLHYRPISRTMQKDRDARSCWSEEHHVLWSSTRDEMTPLDHLTTFVEEKPLSW